MLTLLMNLFIPFASANPAFQVVRQETVSIAPAPSLNPAFQPVIRLPLALVVEVGSVWEQRARLMGHLNKTNRIFSRCGVQLQDVEVTTVTLLPAMIEALRNSDPQLGPHEVPYMADPQVPAVRPLGFLTGARRYYSSAAAYNRDSISRLSIGHSAEAKAGIAGLLDTFHITGDSMENDMSNPRVTTPTYSTFAHELTHLYGNLEHVDIPRNLMSVVDGRGTHTGDLTDWQCEAIRAYTP